MKLTKGIHWVVMKVIIVFSAIIFPIAVQATPTSEVRGIYTIGKNTNVTFNPGLESPYSARLDISVPRTISGLDPLTVYQGPGDKVVMLTNESGNTFQIKVKPKIRIRVEVPSGDGPLLFQAMRMGRGCPVVSGSDGTNPHYFTYVFNYAPNVDCVAAQDSNIASQSITYSALRMTLAGSEVMIPPTAPGTYQGTMIYSVGHGADIGFGPSAEYNLSSIEIPIVVEVVGEVQRITFPAGADLAVLVPPGGWEYWTNSGTRPTVISREIPFTISSSGNTNVTLTACSYVAGNSCQIASDSGELANLTVAITLPAPWTAGSVAVNNVPIRPTSYVRSLLETGYQVVHNSRGKLTIEVRGSQLNKMLDRPGTTWTGNVTVLFDKEYD